MEGDVAGMVGLDLGIDWHWICTYVAIFEDMRIKEKEEEK